MRCLEIGPHKQRLAGFETLDIAKGPLVDHVGDCRKLPFREGTFDLVYASHVIEHIEWYDVEAVITEWARVLTTGGKLEVHTVDSYAIMKRLVRFEETGEWEPVASAWRANLHRNDPHLIATGRMLNFPKGGSIYQLHRSLITPAYLRRVFVIAGLGQFEKLTVDDLRGQRHPDWINMGLRGTKG